METLDPATEGLSPGWLEGMLAKRFRDARVSRVEIETSSEGTNANAQLRVTYAAPTDAPSHIFVKLPPRNPQQRELVLGSGMGRREVLFYRHLAPHVPMHVPQVYAGTPARIALSETFRRPGARSVRGSIGNPRNRPRARLSLRSLDPDVSISTRR